MIYENEYEIIGCHTKGEHAGFCEVRIKHKKTGKIFPGKHYIGAEYAHRFARESPIGQKLILK